MIIMAIDPGTTHSAYVEFDCELQRPVLFGKPENMRLLWKLRYLRSGLKEKPAHLIIEKMQSYGMPMGKEVIDTIFWSGRFAEAWGNDKELSLINRPAVKAHLCGKVASGDSDVRAAIIRRLGPTGTPSNPGPTYGLSYDTWAATALALTWFDRNQMFVLGAAMAARP